MLVKPQGAWKNRKLKTETDTEMDTEMDTETDGRNGNTQAIITYIVQPLLVPLPHAVH